MARWCESPRHDADVAAEPGAYVCAECRRRLRRDLLALPGLWRELEDPPTAPGNGGGGTGLDVNERASEHRSQIVHDLVVWAARVAAERPADPPVRTVFVMAAWLAAQCGAGRHGWCTFQVWAPLMAGAFADDWHVARQLLTPARVRRPQWSGWCPQCGRVSRFEARVFEAPDPRLSVLECDGGHVQPITYGDLSPYRRHQQGQP